MDKPSMHFDTMEINLDGSPNVTIFTYPPSPKIQMASRRLLQPVTMHLHVL